MYVLMKKHLQFANLQYFSSNLKEGLSTGNGLKIIGKSYI